MANQKIQAIEGIGPAYSEKLLAAGIHDTDTLLEASSTASRRKFVAAQTGLSSNLVLKWANMADLLRIRGVGSEFAELLEASGVGTVVELRDHDAEELAEKMFEVNAECALTRTVPSAKVVEGWIAEAKQLDAMLQD